MVRDGTGQAVRDVRTFAATPMALLTDAQLVIDPAGQRWAAGTETEWVLPRGVMPDNDLGPKPRVLRADADAMLRDLRDVFAVSDEAAQGRRLVRHVGRFGLPEICGHGRSIWHARAGTPCTAVGPEGTALVGVRVDQVGALVDAIESAWEAASSLPRGNRIGVRRAQVLASWIGVPPPSRDSAAGQRGLVTAFTTHFLGETNTRVGAAWSPGSAFVPSLVVEGYMGVLATAFLRHVTSGGLGDELECEVCGTPVPRANRRPDQSIYCKSEDCQRRGAALRKRKLREGKAGQ